MLNMSKKLLCGLLCAGLLLSAGCTEKVPANIPNEPDAPTPEVYVPHAPAEDEPVYHDENSEAYRTLYSENPIEEAFSERFSNAMTIEDFDTLSIDYCDAWKDEYHALMEQLCELYPEDADDLTGLCDYTDEAAQAAYDSVYAQHLYTDEDGREQVGAAAVQSGKFAAAEVYRQATILSILNDYREDMPYAFHHKAS